MTALLPPSLIRLHTLSPDGSQECAGSQQKLLDTTTLINYPDCHSVASPGSLTASVPAVCIVRVLALILKIHCLKISKKKSRQSLKPTEIFTFVIKINPPSPQKLFLPLLTHQLSKTFLIRSQSEPPHPSKLISPLPSLYPQHRKRRQLKLADSSDICLPRHQSGPCH